MKLGSAAAYVGGGALALFAGFMLFNGSPGSQQLLATIGVTPRPAPVVRAAPVLAPEISAADEAPAAVVQRTLVMNASHEARAARIAVPSGRVKIMITAQTPVDFSAGASCHGEAVQRVLRDCELAPGVELELRDVRGTVAQFRGIAAISQLDLATAKKMGSNNIVTVLVQPR